MAIGALRALSNIPIGVWILILQAFLWIDASWIYGPFAAQVQQVLQIYFILFLIVFVSLGLKIPTLDKRRENLFNFFILFIIGVVIMTVISPILSSGELAAGQFTSAEVNAVSIAFGFMFLHGLVKAYIEELVFRYAIPTAILGGIKQRTDNINVYAMIISSILFGVFHIAVDSLGGTAFPWYAVIYLSILGGVFYVISQRFGIMGSTAFHFAYNLGVLGMLPKLFGNVIRTQASMELVALALLFSMLMYSMQKGARP